MSSFKRRPVKGAASVRRVMRALPDAARDELLEVLESGSVEIQRLVIAKTPTKSGALRKGVKRRVLKKTMRMQVGLLGTKRGRSKLFYGRIQDLGRKAQTVSVTRGRAKGKAYLMRVRAMKGKKFVTGSYPDARKSITQRLRGIWDRVLRKASAGAGNE